MQKLYHLELERGQVIRDSALLYKRAIIELIFICLHRSGDYDDGSGLRMLCDDGWDQPISFSSAMRHWRTCRLHSSSPHIRTNYEKDWWASKMCRRNTSKSQLITCAQRYLRSYTFCAGENYPIKIIRFPRNEDTLAMFSFLEHYNIPFHVVGGLPFPSAVVQDSEQSRL